MWEIIIGPVIIGVIIILALFLMLGPAIARGLISLFTSIKETIDIIRERGGRTPTHE